MTSVNGDVSIGKDCTIEGTTRSVNGSVKVGDRSTVEDLNTVNGSLRTGDVRLILRDGGKVLGQVDGAGVID